MKILTISAVCLMVGLSAGCMRFRVDPIKVEPIHITMDINIKVDKQLDNFFAFEEELETPDPNAPKTEEPKKI